ncbi:MAG: hypothetical protein ABW145_06735, partial [Candidatus Thiodiazotropha sp.]
LGVVKPLYDSSRHSYYSSLSMTREGGVVVTKWLRFGGLERSKTDMKIGSVRDIRESPRIASL